MTTEKYLETTQVFSPNPGGQKTHTSLDRAKVEVLAELVPQEEPRDLFQPWQVAAGTLSASASIPPLLSTLLWLALPGTPFPEATYTPGSAPQLKVASLQTYKVDWT